MFPVPDPTTKSSGFSYFMVITPFLYRMFSAEKSKTSLITSGPAPRLVLIGHVYEEFRRKCFLIDCVAAFRAAKFRARWSALRSRSELPAPLEPFARFARSTERSQFPENWRSCRYRAHRTTRVLLKGLKGARGIHKPFFAFRGSRSARSPPGRGASRSGAV